MIAIASIAVIVAATAAPALPRASATQPAGRVLIAIHQIESSGRLAAPRGDGGRARGPMQIHRSYWIDAGTPGSWDACERLHYSRMVVLAYMRRYEPAALARGDAEVLARLHNGGPGWRRNPRATDGYWRKVKAAMEGQR
jgi:hypothetical protein